MWDIDLQVGYLRYLKLRQLEAVMAFVALSEILTSELQAVLSSHGEILNLSYLKRRFLTLPLRSYHSVISLL